MNASHSGTQTADSLAPGLVKKYAESCQWDVSYPLIAGGKLFYLCGAVLTAVDLATGNYASGGKTFYSNHGWSAIAYDGGKVFDLLDSGQLTAIDASTGNQLWQIQLPNDVSFTLRAKHIVRLNSASGTGKSTIIAALLGFLQPDDGVITVDGRDLSTMDLTAWRRSIAWVPQQPWLAAASTHRPGPLVLPPA